MNKILAITLFLGNMTIPIILLGLMSKGFEAIVNVTLVCGLLISLSIVGILVTIGVLKITVKWGKNK